MTENVLVVAPGDDRAKKIAKAIASSTASDILTSLREGRQTATQIADRLSLPMTTVQYHLENLLEAEMLEVAEKRWSKKGREVKVYALRDQLVIVAPPTADLRALLTKYAALFSIIAAISIMIMVWAPFVGASAETQQVAGERSLGYTAVPAAGEPNTADTSSAAESTHEKSVTGPVGGTDTGETTPATLPVQPPAAAPVVQPPAALVFFAGGFAVLFLVMTYELFVGPRLRVRIPRIAPSEEE
jgi:DNA-binding transcriptional ArsR family regulator